MLFLLVFDLYISLSHLIFLQHRFGKKYSFKSLPFPLSFCVIKRNWKILRDFCIFICNFLKHFLYHLYYHSLSFCLGFFWTRGLLHVSKIYTATKSNIIVFACFGNLHKNFLCQGERLLLWGEVSQVSCICIRLEQQQQQLLLIGLVVWLGFRLLLCNCCYLRFLRRLWYD